VCREQLVARDQLQVGRAPQCFRQRPLFAPEQRWRAGLTQPTRIRRTRHDDVWNLRAAARRDERCGDFLELPLERSRASLTFRPVERVEPEVETQEDGVRAGAVSAEQARGIEQLLEDLVERRVLHVARHTEPCEPESQTLGYRLGSEVCCDGNDATLHDRLRSLNMPTRRRGNGWRCWRIMVLPGAIGNPGHPIWRLRDNRDDPAWVWLFQTAHFVQRASA